MSWDYWIALNSNKAFYYDRLLELAVSSYDLDKKTRKMGHKDRVQFVLVWWFDNKNKFYKYQTLVSVAKLFKITHGTVIHHYSRRKPSRYYERETECVKDFIES